MFDRDSGASNKPSCKYDTSPYRMESVSFVLLCSSKITNLLTSKQNCKRLRIEFFALDLMHVCIVSLPKTYEMLSKTPIFSFCFVVYDNHDTHILDISYIRHYHKSQPGNIQIRQFVFFFKGFHLLGIIREKGMRIFVKDWIVFWYIQLGVMLFQV